MSERRNDIQGLRALAILSVVLFHSQLEIFNKGYLGVDIFFTLSGFVISSMVFSEFKKNKSFNIYQFFLRRFKRLFPALAFCVSIITILSLFFLSPLNSVALNSVYAGGGAILIISNIILSIKERDYFDPTSENNAFLHTWSLSVEEQFYIFYAILIYFIFSPQKKYNFFNIKIIYLITIISFITVIYNYFSLYSSEYMRILTGFYSPISRTWEFTIGIICYLIIKKNIFHYKYSSFLLTYLGYFLIFLSLFFINKTILNIITIVIGTCCLLLSTNSKKIILENKTMVFIGNISYSWYLWHCFFIVFFSYLHASEGVLIHIIAACIALIPSILSYKFIEVPLKNKKLYNKVDIYKYVLATVSIPIFFLTISLFIIKNNYFLNDIKNFKDDIDSLHIANLDGCANGYVPKNSFEKKCLWYEDANNFPIYLIGDSNADHFSEAVIEAGNRLNSPVRVFTKNGCSFVGRYRSMEDSLALQKCNNYIDQTMSFLRESPPGFLFLSMSDAMWRESARKDFKIGPDKQTATNQKEIINKYLFEDLVSKIKTIKSSSHKII